MLDFFVSYVDKAQCLSWHVDAAPCEAACPLRIDIEAYISAVRQGDFIKALEIIREKCPLPSVCGRVCHHPCETVCKRGEIDESVAIRALKRVVTDLSSEQDNPLPLTITQPYRVAIIGSGPAGLTAAYDLINRGYAVTIYEEAPVAGGMLAVGIPAFDLPKVIVEKEINYVQSLGVEIITNTSIGCDLTIADLFANGYHSVLIAAGAPESRELPIPGTTLKGVIYALPFLRDVKCGKETFLKGKGIVIGGGNVAIDAARTALRLGADAVELVCIESHDDMPAFDWMIKLAEAEGIIINPLLAPEEISGDDDGSVDHVSCRRVISFERDIEEHVNWTLAEGDEAQVILKAEWVVIAIGQQVRFPCDHKEGTLERTQKGTITIADNMTTNLDGVFAAGDIVEMPSTITDSMASGRKAAESIHCYLQGKKMESNTSCDKQFYKTGGDILPKGIEYLERQKITCLSVAERVAGFKEVELALSREEAMREAERCLSCKTCNRCLDGMTCVAFQSTANNGKISPVVNGLLCEGCGRCARSCPYHNIHVERI